MSDHTRKYPIVFRHDILPCCEDYIMNYTYRAAWLLPDDKPERVDLFRLFEKKCPWAIVEHNILQTSHNFPSSFLRPDHHPME